MSQVYWRDLSTRGRLRLRGADRVRFLHGMVTNDIAALRPGAGCHAAMLTVKGKLLADLVVYAGAEELLVELEPEVRVKIRDVLEKHLMMDEVEIEDLTDETRELGVWGEGARAEVARALGVELGELRPYHHLVAGGVQVAAAPELGVPGYHLFGDCRIAGEPLSDEAYEVLRVEAGTPRYGVDMEEDRLVLETGMEDAVSFTKGCYLGQEVVARATSRGHINRKLRGLVLDGSEPAERGAKLSAPGREDAGQITSSVFSTRLGRPIALAYVHRSVWDAGTELQIHQPAGTRAARVVDLPFAS